ncbi:MAG: glycosyltransferase family 4 protein [Planctomycetota bacterium]
MPEKIADALVLTLPAHRTLMEWRSRGTLGREREMLVAMQEQYGRIILVTHGTDQDLLAAQSIRSPEDHWFDVVPTLASGEARNDAEVAQRVLHAVRGGTDHATGRVVIQTMQLDDGGLAGLLKPALVDAGLSVSVIARGGYLPSRVVATEQGPHTPRCVAAGVIERNICKLADAVIGPTQKMLEDLSWRHAVDPETTHVVPNFVLAAEDPTPASEREPATLLTCCSLVPRKRVDRLVRAAAALAADLGDEARLDVLGEGPLRMELMALAEELNAPVHFLGHRPHEEVTERMSKCTAFVMASTFETNPRPLLEAMAQGAPVIVANSPGLAEHIENGVSGVIVPGSPESFAFSLAGVIPDPDWRDMLGAAAAQSVARSSSLERVVAKTLEAHRAAVERAGADEERRAA